MLKKDYDNWTNESFPQTQPSEELTTTSLANEELINETEDIFPSWTADEVDESSKLLYLNFCVLDLSVDLESRGHSVAQFQVRSHLPRHHKNDI